MAANQCAHMRANGSVDFVIADGDMVIGPPIRLQDFSFPRCAGTKGPPRPRRPLRPRPTTRLRVRSKRHKRAIGAAWSRRRPTRAIGRAGARGVCRSGDARTSPGLPHPVRPPQWAGPAARLITPSPNLGQRNVPLWRRLVTRTSPVPSHSSSLIRSAHLQTFSIRFAPRYDRVSVAPIF